VWVDDVDVCGPREARSSTEQALARTALLAAAACALVDAVVFMVATPQLPGTLRIGVLAVIVCVDAALASPARFSGWVTVAHAVAAVGLAVVLRTTPAADMDLIGGAVAAFRAGAWLRGRSSVGALVTLASGAVFSQMVADPGNVLAAFTELMKDAWIPWLVGYYTATRGAFISALRHDHRNELRDATAQVEKSVDRVRTSIARCHLPSRQRDRNSRGRRTHQAHGHTGIRRPGDHRFTHRRRHVHPFGNGRTPPNA
jgi:hypothetical protein